MFNRLIFRNLFVEQNKGMANVEKYNLCAEITAKAMRNVLEKIEKGERDVTKLQTLGDHHMNSELRGLKYERACIAFPTSISVNNCLGAYIYEVDNDLFNKIKENDIVKIEMGVNIDGCMVHFGETICANGQSDSCISFLDSLEKALCKIVKGGGEMTNDDVREFIEAKCTEAGCFPVENTFSYQQLDGQHKTEESKWIVLNHKKYWDDNDELAVEDNLCFDIEPNDIYNLNITVIPGTGDEHTWSERHLPHVYRFNDYFYNLKMKSSRDFLNKVKGTHFTNWFCLQSVVGNDPRAKIGFRECLNNGLLESMPVLYHKEGLPVYTKKFTLFVGDNKSKRVSFKSRL